MNGGRAAIKAKQKVVGYTIVEVLIVMAVSGLMFISAATFINGKQAKTAFSSSVSEFTAQIQAVADQVSDGRYSDVPYQCSAVPGGAPTVSASTTNKVGKNPNCIFLGKGLAFVDLVTIGPSPQYRVVTLVGNRLKAGGEPAITLADAHPTAVTSGSTDLTEYLKVPQGLDVVKLWVNAGGGWTSNKAGFAFLNTLGDTDSNGYKSGATNVNFVYLDAALPPGVGLADQAKICITDDTRYAAIKVGTNGSQLTVNREIQDKAKCESSA